MLPKTNRRLNYMPLIAGATFVSTVGLAQSSFAQEAASLEEVLVTAQKREQSVQDVPIAVTALTEEAIEVNRVFSVVDLSGLAPNVAVQPAAGGTNIPSFTIRGITSYGVVPGSDKQTSVYLDGVYIGANRGNIFQLPDIARIEVLRGPQGTLFGRNATAGAVSITTRDPGGEFGFQQDLSFGERDHFRSRTTIETPTWGGLSGYLSYSMEERDGDIDNLADGVKWDRDPIKLGRDAIAETSRELDNETWFLAVAWDPIEELRITYKYDYSEDTGNPDGTSLSFINFDILASAAPLVQAMLDANPQIEQTIVGTDTSRPDKVWNGFNISRDQEVEGHNLTAVWEVNDSLVLKNILAYREVYVFQPAGISGFDGVPADAIGLPAGTFFCLVCSNSYSDGDQWSNELQGVFTTDTMTLTVGVMYFESDDESGSPPLGAGTQQFAFYPPGPNGAQVLPAPISRNFNETKSYALYAQGEFQLTDAWQLVLGGRVTRDEKEGLAVYGTAPDYEEVADDFKKTKPNYLLGVNYTPTDDMLLYAKFSTAFVSGGSTFGLEYDPEEATSYEIGMKADFFESRMRANLALFDVTYEDYQTAQSGRNVPGYETAGTLIVPLGGDTDVQGIELELTALPFTGLTLGMTLGYQDVEFSDYSDIIFASVNGPQYPNSDYLPTLVPEWNGNLSAIYESAPLFGDAYLSFAATGIWEDDVRLAANPGQAASRPETRAFEFSDAGWTVNARLALKDIKLGNLSGEIALWGRNLTDNDEVSYILNLADLALTGNYPEERIYGVDLSLKY